MFKFVDSFHGDVHQSAKGQPMLRLIIEVRPQTYVNRHPIEGEPDIISSGSEIVTEIGVPDPTWKPKVEQPAEEFIELPDKVKTFDIARRRAIVKQRETVVLKAKGTGLVPVMFFSPQGDMREVNAPPLHTEMSDRLADSIVDMITDGTVIPSGNEVVADKGQNRRRFKALTHFAKMVEMSRDYLKSEAAATV